MESVSSMPETQVTWMMKKCQSDAVAQKFKTQSLYQQFSLNLVVSCQSLKDCNSPIVTKDRIVIILSDVKWIRNCRVFKWVDSFPLDLPAAKSCYLYTQQTPLGAKLSMCCVTEGSHQLQDTRHLEKVINMNLESNQQVFWEENPTAIPSPDKEFKLKSKKKVSKKESQSGVVCGSAEWPGFWGIKTLPASKELVWATKNGWLESLLKAAQGWIVSYTNSHITITSPSNGVYFTFDIRREVTTSFWWANISERMRKKIKMLGCKGLKARLKLCWDTNHLGRGASGFWGRAPGLFLMLSACSWALSYAPST